MGGVSSIQVFFGIFLLTFETLKWESTFGTDMLIASRDESPLVCRAADVSGHSHIGTCHIGTCHIGTCHIGTSTIRDCTISSYYVQAVCTESRYKHQFASNSLLFTPFKTV